MTKLGKITAVLLLCISLLIPSFTDVFAENGVYTNEDIKSIISGIVEQKKQAVFANDSLLSSQLSSNAGSSSADWYALAVGRCGTDPNTAVYLALLEQNVTSRYNTPQKLDGQKATEWHRISLAVLSLGGDPTTFGTDENGEKINLIADGTYNRSKTQSLGAQGVNGYIWALITLDSMCYDVPKDAADTRQDIITEILKNQQPSGAFTLIGVNADSESADTDITAMALQSLAPYYNDEAVYEYTAADGTVCKKSVRTAVDSAVGWLSSVQNSDGGFSTSGEPTAESTVQVMTALCSLGIDPENDSRFIKNGKNVLDGLLKYRTKDGGFAHSLSDGTEAKANSMAGEQALYGLCALYRFRTGQRFLYDFRTPQPQNLKTQIQNLNAALTTEPQTKQQANDLQDEYLKISPTERRYVTNYYNLANALKRFGIENRSTSLTEAMSVTVSANGSVYNIFDGTEPTGGLKFSQSDLEEYNSLPQNLTGENYSDVVRLYTKLSLAENRGQYADVFSDLKAKAEQVQKIHDEVADINEQIAQKLYPFDSINQSDSELISSLIKRTEALSSYDRGQILALDDLYRAKTLCDTSNRSYIIFAAVAAALLLCIVILAVTVKRKREKKKAQNEIINEDW